MTTILVTGFGPYPGAPFNPTGALARRLARLSRPALADLKVIAHEFATSYAAVDHDLPALLSRHHPDALLIFGLAPRAKTLRIEARARNALAPLPDAAGKSPNRVSITTRAPAAMPMPVPPQALIAAARTAQVRAVISCDGGHYLCNYLAWRSAEACARPGGPQSAAFVHTPPLRRLNRDDLLRAGAAMLLTLAAATRR